MRLLMAARAAIVMIMSTLSAATPIHAQPSQHAAGTLRPNGKPQNSSCDQPQKWLRQHVNSLAFENLINQSERLSTKLRKRKGIKMSMDKGHMRTLELVKSCRALYQSRFKTCHRNKHKKKRRVLQDIIWRMEAFRHLLNQANDTCAHRALAKDTSKVIEALDHYINKTAREMKKARRDSARYQCTIPESRCSKGNHVNNKQVFLIVTQLRCFLQRVKGESVPMAWPGEPCPGLAKKTRRKGRKNKNGKEAGKKKKNKNRKRRVKQRRKNKKTKENDEENRGGKGEKKKRKRERGERKGRRERKLV